MIFTGTIANINTALNGMTFTPTLDYFGGATIQIVTDDQGNVGVGGPKTDTDTVNINVTARPVQTFTFEDVYFDFDRYSLTDAAQRILAQAVETLRANPTLRIRIEGHTCSIGTAEYNLALGDRRARSVMQYLVSNGITADRLTTVSFGEKTEVRQLARRDAPAESPCSETMQIVAGN
jgi:outer membrane protein OmpA-like peptidoglycan-associated protein